MRLPSSARGARREEAEDAEDLDEATVSLSAMEQELKPKILAIFDRHRLRL